MVVLHPFLFDFLTYEADLEIRCSKVCNRKVEIEGGVGLRACGTIGQLFAIQTV